MVEGVREGRSEGMGRGLDSGHFSGPGWLGVKHFGSQAGWTSGTLGFGGLSLQVKGGDFRVGFRAPLGLGWGPVGSGG